LHISLAPNPSQASALHVVFHAMGLNLSVFYSSVTFRCNHHSSTQNMYQIYSMFVFSIPVNISAIICNSEDYWFDHRLFCIMWGIHTNVLLVNPSTK
jgi:hypothetical protein